MGCQNNEVRRGLGLTMEAKGVRLSFNCVRSRRRSSLLFIQALCTSYEQILSVVVVVVVVRRRRGAKTSISSWLISTRSSELRPPDTWGARI